MRNSLRIALAVTLPALGGCGNAVEISPQAERLAALQARPAPEERPRSSRVAREECPEICAPNVRALKQLIREGDFEAVEARIADYDSAYAANVLCEPHVWTVYENLGEPGPDWMAELDRWVASRPESAAVHVIRADALMDAGLRARGSKAARETPPENFRRMREYFEKAERDLVAAAEIAPTHMVAAGVGIWIARTGGKQETAEGIANAYLERDPANYRVRRLLVEAFEPKWGGSLADMERVAREAQPYLVRNPRLRVLLGFHHAYVAEEAYWDKKYDLAIDRYTEALAFGDYGTAWAQGRARAYKMVKKLKLALDDIEYAKLARPNDASTFATGGWIRMAKRDYQGALEEFDRAIEISPNYGWARENRGFVNEYFGNWEQAAEDYRIALRGDPDDAWTAAHLGRVLLEKLDRPEEALAPLRVATQSEPGDRFHWFALGQAQEQSGDPGAAESYRRYLAMAEPNNARDNVNTKIAQRYLNPSVQASAAEAPGVAEVSNRMPGLGLFMR